MKKHRNFFLTICFLILSSSAYNQGTTVINRGDLAILAVNANLASSGVLNTKDEISFVCFKDITNGTEIQILDAGYENCLSGLWSCGQEGGAILKRTGGTIPAGTVITFRNTSPFSFLSPDNAWSVTDLYTHATNSNYSVLSADFNINANGDQIYFAQGGVWQDQSTMCTINSTRTSPNASFPGNSGRILFGFSTSGSWLSFQQSSGESGIYPGMQCFSMSPTGSSAYNKYTGPLTATTQTTWISRISNPANWSSYSSTSNFTSNGPNYSGGLTLSILSGGDIPVASWNSPLPMCSNSGSLDLSSLITGTLGGTFSGTGITGNNFNPTSLNGNYNITYSVNYNTGSLTCPITQTNTITVIGTPSAPTLSVTNNCGNSTLSASGITGTITWNDGGSGNPRTVTNSASYSLTQTVSGCTSSTSNIITTNPATVPSAPVLSVVNNCGNSILTASGITGTITWSDGGNGNPRTVTNSASYSLTQTLNGCTSSSSNTVTTNPTPIPSAPTLSVVNNCGNSILTASGITGTITWNDGGYGNPRTVTNSASYSLTQTVNGCTSSSSNTVTTNPTPIPSAPTLSVVNNCGNSTLTAFGISGTITWNEGGNGNPRTVTNSASYSLTQTVNGCTSSSSNTVTTTPGTPPAIPILSVVNNCGNSTLTATNVTGVLTWSDGGSGNPRIVTSSSNYSLTQTVNGCTSSSSNTVTTSPTPVPSAPTLSVVNNCGNSTLTASGITGTITWSDGGSGNPRTVTNSASYSLTQTVNGCTSSSSNTVTTAPITIPPAPVLSLINDCGISTLTASGIVGHINWSDGGNGNPRTVTINNSYSLTQNIGKCTSAVSNVVTSAPLVIPNPPVLSIINNCGNSTITASNVTGILTWNDGGTGNPRTVAINNSYSVSQTVGGCTSSLSNIVVSVPKQIPSPPILSVLDNCGSSTLTASNVIGTLTWNDGGSGNPRTVNNAASFSLTQNLNGCESSTSNVVITNPKAFPPAPNVTSPISYCQNAIASALMATGSNILWYNVPLGGIGSSTAPIPSTNTQGIFNFDASQTVNGCESNLATIQVNILALPTPANISPSGLIEFCSGQTITLHSSYATGNQWLKNGTEITGGINDSLVVSTSGDFSIKITNTDGCQSISNIVTTILHPLPNVFAGADKYIYEGDSTQLNATASGGLLFNYEWNPKVYLSSDTILKPWTIKPPFDILYKLTATNEKGCSNSDDILIHVINKLIIPNVFSPNGDNVNDTWEIKNINTNPFCTVDVYDRNGQVVYHSGGYSKPWDGTYHGKKIPNGVYYYIISEGKNIPLKSGTVTLLR